MFCTVKKNGNKYAVYLSERIRENGKVKSKDKYLFTLKTEEIQNKAYEDRLQYTALSDEEKGLVISKLNNMDVSLYDTTKDKPLHTTTGARVEFKIEVVDDCRFIDYEFYAGDTLVYSLCDSQFEVMKLGQLMMAVRSLFKENGITDEKAIGYLKEKTIDIYEYYADLKKKREAERSEVANYYKNTIFALQMKIAELQSNSSSVKRNTTTDITKVKKIYRALASKLHPDNGGSDELMQMLNELKDMIN